MKISILFGFFVAALMSSIPSNAEIIKYKGLTGFWTYSDTPPPNNTKHEVIGKKKMVPIGVNNSTAAPANADATKNDKTKAVKAKEDDKETAAANRQKAADQEKHNDQVIAEQKKIKEDNCKVARANMAAYAQGGRVYKANENGGRDYMDDKALESGKAQAQQEIQANCSG